MPSKTTFKITRIWDMLCRQGPSERYAPLGLSFPPLPRRAPFRSRSRGRLRRSDGSCRPVMFGWRIFQSLAMPIWHCTEPKKWQMIPRQITMSLDKRNRDCKTCQHGKAELFSSSGQSPLIFYPLDNRDPLLLVNYQKVSLLEESQEVGMKWVLGRSASFISACNILAYNIL